MSKRPNPTVGLLNRFRKNTEEKRDKFEQAGIQFEQRTDLASRIGLQTILDDVLMDPGLDIYYKVDYFYTKIHEIAAPWLCAGSSELGSDIMYHCTQIYAWWNWYCTQRNIYTHHEAVIEIEEDTIGEDGELTKVKRLRVVEPFTAIKLQFEKGAVIVSYSTKAGQFGDIVENPAWSYDEQERTIERRAKIEILPWFQYIIDLSWNSRDVPPESILVLNGQQQPGFGMGGGGLDDDFKKNLLAVAEEIRRERQEGK